VRQILNEAIEPTIEGLLKTDRQISVIEFERLAAELTNKVAEATRGQTPILQDEDINRAGIYREHPSTIKV
jgi:hypothetical protein